MKIKNYFEYKMFTIFYRINVPKNKTNQAILFFHGKSTHSKYLDNILNSEILNNFFIFSFDYPGKGKSHGIRGDFNAFKYLPKITNYFITKMKKKYHITRLHVIGESYGSSVAFYLYHKKILNIKIESLIFIPGLFNISSFNKLINRVFLHIGNIIFPHYRVKKNDVPINRFTIVKKYQNFLNSDKYFDRQASVVYIYSLLKFFLYFNKFKYDMDIPLLIFHGENDNYCSVDFVKNSIDKIKTQKKLVIMKNDEHWLLGSSDLLSIQNIISNWITNEIIY